MLSDERDLGTDVHRRLMSDVAVTTVVVEAVEHTVQTKSIIFRRLQRHDVSAEVVVADCWQ